MATAEHPSPPIFSLPNEILWEIFDHFSSPELLQWTPTCRKLHKLILRIIHRRLQLAACLDGYELYLKCHPPAKEWRAPKMLCNLTNTDGLADFLAAVHDEERYVGQVKSIFGLYSRYRTRKEEAAVTMTYNPMTGSRTYTMASASSAAAAARGAHTRPEETVTVDAHELFAQLTTNVHLGYREPILVGMHPVSAGWLRVWRDWLGKHCESRSWADGEPVVVQPSEATAATADGAVVAPLDPKKDPCVLWLGDNNAGIRIRVKEKQVRTNTNPFASDVEEPVSFLVEFDEVLVRTSHLIVVLDEVRRCMDTGTGKAIVFGSFRG